MVLTGRCLCHCVEESSSSESSVSESSESDSQSDSDESQSVESYSLEASGSASVSSSSSSSGNICYFPSGTPNVLTTQWTVYESDSLSVSGLTHHEAVDEGVDSSDDNATAIRPAISGDGVLWLGLSFDNNAGPEEVPPHWTQIDSVTARMRARVLQYGDEAPTDQVIECKIGDDGNAEHAGSVTFTVSGTGYQTYEAIPTGGVTLPALISDLDLQDLATRWDMAEVRKNEHSFEISALEVCLTGS